MRVGHSPATLRVSSQKQGLGLLDSWALGILLPTKLDLMAAVLGAVASLIVGSNGGRRDSCSTHGSPALDPIPPNSALVIGQRLVQFASRYPKIPLPTALLASGRQEVGVRDFFCTLPSGPAAVVGLLKHPP
ncbi:hypothetical protein BS50DRAFT_630396 [Corynespora cassiicola Philippines]|uniref:Uncharacterized protein n=1 Tax=Corynespora cassiicola Philippines TaxID=1448308 RepID=A0A2T2P3T3_CORCC|nr:hypothetical protein BS50DRAFT_630396 [Corynespora cassiicola Philippines]